MDTQERPLPGTGSDSFRDSGKPFPESCSFLRLKGLGRSGRVMGEEVAESRGLSGILDQVRTLAKPGRTDAGMNPATRLNKMPSVPST
ncbi:MAG: hypothetical protein EA422_10995 [Gemmatimonadales bacterium]|nr:MAG: hypothetical protein EA422_10995 [Gemmatimonadales bacterium]